MLRWTTGALALYAGLMLLDAPPVRAQDRGGMGQANGGSITWLTSKQKAWEEARRTGKPIWALFR